MLFQEVEVTKSLSRNLFKQHCVSVDFEKTRVIDTNELAQKKIEELNRKQTPVVFLLWGAYAQKKAEIINNPIHKKLCSVHPSPLSASRGFLGCKHFSKTNEILANNGMNIIEW